jgi:hypothetical protein
VSALSSGSPGPPIEVLAKLAGWPTASAIRPLLSTHVFEAGAKPSTCPHCSRLPVVPSDTLVTPGPRTESSGFGSATLSQPFGQ